MALTSKLKAERQELEAGRAELNAESSKLPDHAAAPALTAGAIKERALALGFDRCGIAPATDLPELPAFDAWLARGFAGEMAYLARNAARRRDVRAVLPTARAVIVLATIYNTPAPYSTEIADPSEALIARYAWGDDYHDVIGARLEALVAWMRERSPVPFEAKAYVDTGPVLERVYARHAGLGWIGKNTCLIDPDLGSWLFLSEIICSLDLEPDEPGIDMCGTCTLCLEACPTGALVEPGVLDATRCLSYLTIELKGSVSEEFRPSIGSRVYGCDICQEVCPWNQQPAVSHAPEWQARPAFRRPSIEGLWRMPDDDLRRALKGNAMKRTRLKGLRRNLALALGGLGTAEARAALEWARTPEANALAPTLADPLVTDAIDWSLRQCAAADGAVPGR